MGKEFVAIKVKVRGQKRLITRMNKIIKNVPAVTNKLTDKVMRDIKKEAQRIIRSETQGTGALANGMMVKKSKGTGKDKTATKWTLGFNDAVARYSKEVHDGFRAHWVHRDMIAEWLALHPNVKLRSGKWLEVGYPKNDMRRDGSPKQSAKWLQEGGTKFFTKAYRRIWEKSKDEYNKAIKKVIRGK